eukprot:9471788-Pyramimonas_sp.AAC.1
MTTTMTIHRLSTCTCTCPARTTTTTTLSASISSFSWLCLWRPVASLPRRSMRSGCFANSWWLSAYPATRDSPGAAYHHDVITSIIVTINRTTTTTNTTIFVTIITTTMTTTVMTTGTPRFLAVWVLLAAMLWHATP